MVGLFLFDYIVTFFDRLCLNYYLGESAVGIYGANYDLIKQILIFFMAIQSIVVYPHINRAYEDGEKGHFNRLLTFNLNVLFMVFIPLSIIIIYFNPLISELFIGDKFRVNSPQLIPVFATIFFIWGCKIYHFDYFFQLKEKMHYPMFILGFGSIINVGLNIYLIPIIGILGAAYATLIVYASIFIISVIVANYLIQIDYQLIVVIKVIIFLLIALFTINIPFISQVHGILKIIIFMLIYSSLTLKYNFTKIAPLLREIL